MYQLKQDLDGLDDQIPRKRMPLRSIHMSNKVTKGP